MLLYTQILTKMFKLNYFLLIVASGILLASCSGTEEKKEAKVEVETENKFNSEEFDFVLPQPISLAKAFQAAGISYSPGVTNPADAKTTYQSKVKQLLNLGVYSTDLAYCAINEKPQEARAYLQAIQDLGSSVGLKPVFSDKKLIEKFDKNLSNMEAIEDLIYDIQERSESYMDDNDIRYLSVVQFSGSWTEGMYLGIKDIEKNPNSNLPVTIVEQMTLLTNIIKGIKTYPIKDDVLQEVINKLEDIEKTYHNLESVKSAEKSQTFVSPKLAQDEFRTLASKIKEVRAFIIK